MKQPRHVRILTPETCTLCHEPTRVCLCWRCMDCETLHREGEGDWYESDTGEMVCSDCWDNVEI